MRALDGSIDGLIGFLTDWHGEPEPRFGVPASELPAGLPEALRRLYAVAGRWPGRDPGEHLPDAPGLLQHQDFLVRAADLSAVDAWAAAWAEAEPVWENGWYVFEEPTHSFRRSGPFLLSNIAGDGWIGWNDAGARLCEPLAAEVHVIHSPE